MHSIGARPLASLKLYHRFCFEDVHLKTLYLRRSKRVNRRRHNSMDHREEIDEFQSSAEINDSPPAQQWVAVAGSVVELGGASGTDVCYAGKAGEGKAKGEERSKQRGDNEVRDEVCGDLIDEFESSPESENPLLARNPSVVVVDNDEFELLDGASELAVLTSELYDVRQRLAVSRNNGKYVPLRIYRSHCRNSLSVSDIQSGMWCQSQLEYRYLYPHMTRTKQWEKKAKEGKEVQKKTPVMIKGSNMHEKKELEVHKKVEIDIRTREDKSIAGLLNTYQQLSIIKSGKMEREISVFGDPFNTGILLTGIIDQVEYNKESMELMITDYKTRRSNTLPQRAQKLGHDFQLMMYKMLLDGFTRGDTELVLLTEHLELDITRKLGPGIMEYIQSLGMTHLFCSSPTDSLTFGEAAHCLLRLIAGLDLPPVCKLSVQYEYQISHELIGVQSVAFDREWTKEVLDEQEKFWTGENLPSGPEIEDLWKCRSCQYQDVCVWTKQKQLEKSPASKISKM